MTTLSPMLVLEELAASTGLSADILRIWERRFGFPAGQRSADGQRRYAGDQIGRLCHLRVLVTLGARPAELILLEDRQLEAMIAAWPVAGAGGNLPAGPDILALEDCLRMVQDNACADLESRLRSHIIARGLGLFVVTLAAPLCTAVGLAWEQGHISIFQEHLFADVLGRTLRLASASLFQPDFLRAGRPTPSVLLAVPPGEQHVLGLAMVEALLRLEGCYCLNLGHPLPLAELAEAAQAQRCDILALSFSQAYEPETAIAVLNKLQGMVDRQTTIWAGGACAALSRPLPARIVVHRRLDTLPSAVAQWRRDHR